MPVEKNAELGNFLRVDQRIQREWRTEGSGRRRRKKKDGVCDSGDEGEEHLRQINMLQRDKQAGEQRQGGVSGVVRDGFGCTGWFCPSQQCDSRSDESEISLRSLQRS